MTMGSSLEASNFEITSNDNSIHLKAQGTPGDIRVFEASQSAPDDMGYFDILRTLTSEAKERGSANAEYVDKHLTFGLPLDVEMKPRIDQVQNHVGLVAGLGYGVERQIDTNDGITHIRQTLRYPSVDRLNGFMGEVFPGEDEIRFKAYNGTDFPAEEFIRTFVEEGKVLVASEEPYAHHDLTDHASGWIGVNPELAKILRERLAMYLERSDAELKLPKVPISEHTNDLATRAFLNPSMVVIENASKSLDEFTDRIPEIVLFSRRSEQFDRTDRDITGAIENLFSMVEFSFVQALGHNPDEVFNEFPKQIISRYKKGEDFFAGQTSL